MLRRRKLLLRELREAQARLSRISQVLAVQMTAEFDNPTYGRGYRDALRMIAQTALSHQRPIRHTTNQRARQSQITRRRVPIDDSADETGPASVNMDI